MDWELLTAVVLAVLAIYELNDIARRLGRIGAVIEDLDFGQIERDTRT